MVLEQRFKKNACSSSWQKKTHGSNVGSKEIKKFHSEQHGRTTFFGWDNSPVETKMGLEQRC